MIEGPMKSFKLNTDYEQKNFYSNIMEDPLKSFTITSGNSNQMKSNSQHSNITMFQFSKGNSSGPNALHQIYDGFMNDKLCQGSDQITIKFTDSTQLNYIMAQGGYGMVAQVYSPEL